MKRLFDFVLAAGLLIVLSPVIVVVSALIWLEDRHSPFYVATRVGKGGAPFRMVKFRSMRVGADRSGVMSTSGTDTRITRMGRVVRAYKLDEIPQLFNVIKGDMSFVGPRPNVTTEVALYSDAESRLLAVRPGITDLASIVFSDEGDILSGSDDPDQDYNLLIRPWKSRLGLHYVDNRSLWMDIQLMVLTAVAVVSKARALKGVVRLLERTDADPALIEVARRVAPLEPTLPPGVAREDWDRHLHRPAS